ncbi:MAG: DUF1684 domain-containing protein [Bdellovibrionales bacterium]|nr:DUF1684 domain-containing protein [Bdellovibrionales bacterium]
MIISILLSGMMVLADSKKAIVDWREQQEIKLRSETGWLTVVGLEWLKEGANRVGSDAAADVNLPERLKIDFGVIEKSGSQFMLTLKSTEGVLIDGKVPVGKKVELKNDGGGATPTEVKFQGVTFFVIHRGERDAVRIKDAESVARKTFEGRRWFPPREDFKVKAKWVKATTPKKLFVPDILGNTTEENSPGYAEFEREGQLIRLYPTQEGDKLFFVFKDKTSGKETYGAARFLYADPPQDGFVDLDFNKAVNPPCAFTKFATCPLPPIENVMKVSIVAGEINPASHP